MLVNHSIPLEERAMVYFACVIPVLLFVAETWALIKRLEGKLASYDHRMFRYMSKVRWQDRITNKEVRRRCGLKESEVEMVWSCKT